MKAIVSRLHRKERTLAGESIFRVVATAVETSPILFDRTVSNALFNRSPVKKPKWDSPSLYIYPGAWKHACIFPASAVPSILFRVLFLLFACFPSSSSNSSFFLLLLLFFPSTLPLRNWPLLHALLPIYFFIIIRAASLPSILPIFFKKKLDWNFYFVRLPLVLEFPKFTVSYVY